ncbi:hypothetical protein D0B54_15930 [Solimonas sp. K1W22B-7]|uniref:hypothetical protein n=1 Tax=Solimonas sp. K1W22B-7 TaxID=2303331 RepID=UPI000E3341B9|nr:hypothetical protein [Solimonas sp. K1W22B-7]AXQ30068.1 hypothetical protein D0B54_15930 [Solimonas sp. K1W22B-7]
MNTRATWIRPLDLGKLLESVLTLLEGNAVVVLEGHLRQFDFPAPLRCSLPDGLGPETPHGEERMALRLAPGSALLIHRAIVEDPDWVQKISGMQVLVDGQRVFLVGDNFHEECISVWPAAPASLAAQLVAQGVADFL